MRTLVYGSCGLVDSLTEEQEVDEVGDGDGDYGARPMQRMIRAFSRHPCFIRETSTSFEVEHFRNTVAYDCVR